MKNVQAPHEQINNATQDYAKQKATLISSQDENFLRSSFYKSSDAGSSNGFTSWKKQKRNAGGSSFINKPSSQFIMNDDH